MEINLSSKLNTLSELSRLKLADILSSISGSIHLIIEQSLIRPLDKICGAKWLKLYDVEKIYQLEDKFVLEQNYIPVFLISSNIKQFKRILNILEANNAVDPESEEINYHAIVVPKMLSVFNTLLEECGLYGRVKIHPFLWQYIYLDKGLISMELPNFYPELFISQDLSLMTAIGKSLYFLFDVVGKPNIIVSIGKHAEYACQHIEYFEQTLEPSDKTDSDFGAIVIMDRSVDYISALLTNVTYTGLLTEIYKIDGGFVERRFSEKSVSDSQPSTEASTSGSESAESKSKTVFVIDSNNDTVYSEIKNRHISEVSDILGNQARQLKLESQTSQEMALSEIKTYVQTKLQSVTMKSKYLSYHLKTCEKIISELGHKFETLQSTERYFMDNVNKSENITRIGDYIMTENELRSLRLICLISLTQKLSWDEYNNLKLQYLHRHGYHLLYVFQQLLDCGLILQPQSKLLALSLPSIGQKKDFYSIANKLKLIPAKPEELNVRAPTCPSYVFGGNYIPIIAQLLKLMIQAQTLNEFTSKLNLLNGTIKTETLDKPFPLQHRTILVFVIGGLTYAEIAACNLIEKLCGCKIVLASNCLISANDLVNQCLEH